MTNVCYLREEVSDPLGDDEGNDGMMMIGDLPRGLDDDDGERYRHAHDAAELRRRAHERVLGWVYCLRKRTIIQVYFL